MTTLVELKLQFPDLAGKLRTRMDEIELFIAAMMQTNRGMLFDSEGSYNGRPGWEPLKMRQGQILKKSGALSRSLQPNGGGGYIQRSNGEIAIGTTVFYAAMMNWGTTKLPGGVLRPKKAKALKIPQDGGKFMYRKSVRIPARRFDDWNDQDENEMSIALMNKLLEVLSE